MAPLVVILARLRRWQNTRLTVLCCARVGLPGLLPRILLLAVIPFSLVHLPSFTRSLATAAAAT